MQPSLPANHPYVPAWTTDYGFYLVSAKDYIHRARTTTDKYSREIWLDYASSAIIGCEDCIRKMEELK